MRINAESVEKEKGDGRGEKKGARYEGKDKIADSQYQSVKKG